MEPEGQQKIAAVSPNTGRITKSTFTLIYSTLFVVLLPMVIFPPWYNNKEDSLGISVLLAGWLGIFGGVISWYWFVPAILFLRAIKKETFFQRWGIIKKSLLFITYIACIGTMVFAVVVGRIEPGDIDCQCTIITGYGVGYYGYILLITYLSMLALICSVPLEAKDQNKAIRISSGIAMLVIVAIVVLKMTTGII